VTRHAPQDWQRLKGDFHRWLLDWHAITNAEALLFELMQCNDPLPRDYLSQYDLPNGSTYRDAALLFASRWNLTDDSELK
jgi:hypothetical protein